MTNTKVNLDHAVLDGICYEMKDILLMQEEFVGEIKKVCLSGGITKSPIWCQMFVDILNKPVELTEVTETGALGAVMYAGIGFCIYIDCKDAAEKCIRIKETYVPNSDNVPVYEEGFNRYMRAVDALNGILYM